MILVAFYVYWDDVVLMIEPFLFWFEDHFYQGIALYAIIFVAMTIFLIPTTFLVLGGALIFTKFKGPSIGFFLTLLLVMASSVVGGVISFVIGRFFIRTWIRKYLTKKIKLFRAIDLGLKHNGFKMITLMRMTPIMPHNLFPYIMSVTSLRIKDFIYGSVIGMTPNTCITIYIGMQLDSIDDILEGNYGFGPWSPVLITIGVVMVIMLTSLMITFSKEELSKLINTD